jgi:hypothetical protein
MKTTFTHATSSETFTRKSVKAMTHVVIVTVTQALLDARPDWDASRVGDEYVWGWHTSAELAAKKVAFYQSHRNNRHGSFRIETVNG